MQENQRLAEVQKENNILLEKLYDTNEPNEDYFGQFGIYPR